MRNWNCLMWRYVVKYGCLCIREKFKCANIFVTLKVTFKCKIEIVKMVIYYHVLRGYLSIYDDIEMCENVLGVFNMLKYNVNMLKNNVSWCKVTYYNV